MYSNICLQNFSAWNTTDIVSILNISIQLGNIGTEQEVKDRASRAAAAARRWREYSRRGVDKPATYKLPDTVSNTEK